AEERPGGVGDGRRVGPVSSLQAAAVIATAAMKAASFCRIVPPVRSERRRKWIPTDPRPASHLESTCLLAPHIPGPYVAGMSVQAIAWSASGAVRIVDQRALPEARIERDLESGEAVADAIRTLQVRGAPLIGIAAAMGLVAGTRELRGAPRDAFLARIDQVARLLGATRPTAVNLRWALARMVRAAAQTPATWEASAIWERLQAEATAIWEEDRAMCRRIGEAGLPLVPTGTKVLTHCNAGALATGGIGTALAPIYLAHDAGRQ